jgi:hypothetical protein
MTVHLLKDSFWYFCNILYLNYKIKAAYFLVSLYESLDSDLVI